MGFDKSRYKSRLDGLGLNGVQVDIILTMMETLWYEAARAGMDELSAESARILRARTGEKRDEPSEV